MTDFLTHREIIKALTARRICDATGLKTAAVYNWQARGISRKIEIRAVIAALAHEQGLSVNPVEFPYVPGLSLPSHAGDAQPPAKDSDHATSTGSP